MDEITREEFDALRADVTAILTTMQNIEESVTNALPEFSKALNSPLISGMLRMLR